MPSYTALIKLYEGCHLEAYPDPLTGGDPITIGWGSTREKNGSPFQLGDRITQVHADHLLEWQVSKEFLPELEEISYWNEMSEHQQCALTSFAYNLGAHFYGTVQFETISNCLGAKKWDEVPQALMLYRNPGSNVEIGLARRRYAEGLVWCGVSPADAVSRAESRISSPSDIDILIWPEITNVKPNTEVSSVPKLTCNHGTWGKLEPINSVGIPDAYLADIPKDATLMVSGVVSEENGHALVTFASSDIFLAKSNNQFASRQLWIYKDHFDGWESLDQEGGNVDAEVDRDPPTESVRDKFDPNKPIDWNNPQARVSKYFTVSEVTQGDSRRIPTNQQDIDDILRLALELDRVREAWGSPIGVTSWFRPEPINSQVGGVPGSQHTYGRAADIYTMDSDGFSARDREFENWLDTKAWKNMALGYGVRSGRGFTHVDTRSGHIRWNY